MRLLPACRRKGDALTSLGLSRRTRSSDRERIRAADLLRYRRVGRPEFFLTQYARGAHARLRPCHSRPSSHRARAGLGVPVARCRCRLQPRPVTSDRCGPSPFSEVAPPNYVAIGVRRDISVACLMSVARIGANRCRTCHSFSSALSNNYSSAE